MCIPGLVVIGGCGLSEPPPFSPESLARIQTEAARPTAERVLPPLPTTMRSIVPENVNVEDVQRPPRKPLPPLGDAVRLTLQEIVHRAVANNHEVRVAGYQAAIDEVRITEAESRFDPTAFSNLTFQREFPQNRFGGELRPTEVLTQTLQGGVRQVLPNGAQVELRGQTSRADNDLPLQFGSNNVDPFWTNELTFQITQPLLRDFGGKVNRAQIVVARNTHTISKLDWRDRLEETLVAIEQAYWELAFAERNVRILEQLLTQTEDTLDVLIKRLRQDTTRVQVSQAYARVAQRNAELVVARRRIGELSDRIKRLMNDPDLPVSGNVLILASDKPVDEPIRFNLADQIETAMQNRVDLMQQKARINSADWIVEAGKNNMLPQLNFVSAAGLQGVGNDFDTALTRQGNTDLFVWQAGLAFEVPIGNRGPRAIYQRTLLQRQQAIEQYRALAEAAAEEVKVAHRAVETAWEEMIATRESRFAAEDALSAIEQRERAGEPLTPNFVELKLDRQRELASAAQAEAQAVANYNVAIANIERAKGTLLRYNNVVLKEEPGPAFAPQAKVEKARRTAK